MTALFFWVVLGGLVGAFVKSVVWYERSQGWLACILFGVAGGIAGGYLRRIAGASDGFDLGSMGLIILGAAAALGVYQLFASRAGTSETTLRKAA